MNEYCVYKCTSPEGKSYIGRTNNLQRRLMHHKKPSSKNRGFKEAIQKFGFDSFKNEILQSGLTLAEADEQEYLLIITHKTLYPNGYNLKDGGKYPKMTDEVKYEISRKAKGRKRITPVSDATRKKLSEAHKGKIVSEQTKHKLAEIARNMPLEQRQKIANTLKGRHHTEESKLKIGIGHLGMKHKEETKLKMSIAQKGKPKSDSHKSKMSESRKEARIYNNGIIQLRRKECPEGFTLGKLK